MSILALVVGVSRVRRLSGLYLAFATVLLLMAASAQPSSGGQPQLQVPTSLLAPCFGLDSAQVATLQAAGLELAATHAGTFAINLAAERTDAQRLLPPKVVTLLHIEFGQNDRTLAREASGPLLFYVSSGSVVVSVDGALFDYQTGSHFLIKPEETYAVGSPYGPSSVLRLSIEPPDRVSTVGNVVQLWADPPTVTTVPDEEGGVNYLLARHQLIPPAPDAQTLLIGCLTWAAAEGELTSLRMPPTMGMLVLEGRLRVHGEGELGPGACLLADAITDVGIEPLDPQVVTVLFGVVEGTQPPTIMATPSASGGEASESRTGLPSCVLV